MPLAVESLQAAYLGRSGPLRLMWSLDSGGGTGQTIASAARRDDLQQRVDLLEDSSPALPEKVGAPIQAEGERDIGQASSRFRLDSERGEEDVGVCLGRR